MEVIGNEEINRIYQAKSPKKTSSKIQVINPESPKSQNFESDDENNSVKSSLNVQEDNDTGDSLKNINSPSGSEEENENIDSIEKVELPLGWRNSKTLIKKKYADITKDLEKYDFPDVVKSKAIELAITLKLKPHKNKPKLQQIFFLVTSAYAECGQLCDDNRVARELSLKQTDINQSRAIYNPVRTGYTKPSVPSKIPNWVLTYLSDIGLSEDLKDDVDYLIKSILVKEKNLRVEDSKITSKSKKIKDYYRPDIALAGILYELEIRTLFKSKDRENKERLIIQLGRKPNIVISLLNYMKKVDNNA